MTLQTCAIMWYHYFYHSAFFFVVQVIEMPEHNPGNLGGTMRLGKRRTVFKTTQQSVLCKYRE